MSSETNKTQSEETTETNTTPIASEESTNSPSELENPTNSTQTESSVEEVSESADTNEVVASTETEEEEKESIMDKIEDAVEDIKDKVEDAVDKAEDIAEDVMDKIEDKIEDITDKVEDIVEDVKDKAEDIIEEVKDKAEDIVEEAQEKVEDIVEEVQEKVEDIVEKVKGEDDDDDDDDDTEDAEVTEAVEEVSETVEETAEESTEEAIEVVAETDAETTEVDSGELAYYTNLLNKAKAAVAEGDLSAAGHEIDNVFFQWNEGPDVEGTGPLYKELEALKTDVQERKKAHYEEQSKIREENLEKKKEVLKELAEIVARQEWNATKEVARIRGRFENIKYIPQDQAEELEERFNKLVTEFEDHKVDRLVKKLQKEEENLQGKLVIIDKMENLIKSFDDSTTDFETPIAQFEDLIRQWRKVGRVPIDKSDDIWDRFNKAQDAINEQRLKFDANYRKEVEKSLGKKKVLIDEAEALIDEENLAEAARKVNKLHKLWKKTGNLPQKDENELWERFKTATDQFNKVKSENLEQLRDEEKQNLDEKMKLIQQAEGLRDNETEDWNTAHQRMQELMNQWKAIGPVPRKKSGKIWKSFKEAMDAFYDKRRSHLKDQRSEQKDNLNKKREIITRIFELAEGEDLAASVDEVKKLQGEFKDAGFVPLKQKNKVWKQYREACDLFYDRFRSRGNDRGMERKLAAQGVNPEARKEIIEKQKQLNGLKKEVSALEEEVLQYSDSITYFKPTKKGQGLRDEIQQKIDESQVKLAKKKQQVNKLLSEIDELQSGDEE